MTHEEYVTTIGLEIHVELKTETKMFCASPNRADAPAPNSYVCPICMGHPGTLPVINKKAVESVIRVGLALGSTIATYTEFDRKNYFYPDIPKGYQISQYLYPLVKGGSLLGVDMTRVHLEEDTARSLHDQGSGSLIDYNRAGVPLMELVTEPVIHDAKTASDFAKELQLLLRTLDVSDAHMEKGQMRVEANISVSRADSPAGGLGTKVEVKNLNSFKSVEGAIAFEVGRQKDLLESGGVVAQETRGWDEQALKTFSQRKKESSHDYRYFPDPDLPKIDLSIVDSFNISRLNDTIPELPNKKRLKYEHLGLSRQDADTLATNIEEGVFFDKVTIAVENPAVAVLAANYLISDVFGMLLMQKLSIKDASVSGFANLMRTVFEGKITSRVAKDLLHEVLFLGIDPMTVIQERDLGVKGASELVSVVDQILQDNQKVVLEYRSGKGAALQFLIGQGMRLTKGSASPASLTALFIERIG